MIPLIVRLSSRYRGQRQARTTELWRGARIVLRLLSQAEKHNVSELSFDSKQLHTGLNFLIFDRPCEEYNQLVAIMKGPGFRRLHLSLLTGSSGYWTGFQSGLFRQTVSLAKELTHVHFSTTFNDGSHSLMRDPPIPLKEVLPIKEWPNLSHLALSRFSVDTSELMDILKLAPSSLRSLDLEFIEFPFDELCLTGLLERMREELDWTERDQPLKPTVTIAYCRGGSSSFQTRWQAFSMALEKIPWMEQIHAAPKTDTGQIMTFLRRSTRGPTSISRILRNWELFVRNATQLIPSRSFECRASSFNLRTLEGH